MTQKPEWFELSEGDDQESNFEPAVKRSKRLPITAVLVSTAIIIGGAFLANANDESPASAETVSAPASTSATSPADTSASPSASPSSAQKGIANPSTSKGDVPSIGNLPQRGGEHEGDDNFGNRGDRPHHDGEHHGDRLPPAGGDSGDDN